MSRTPGRPQLAPRTSPTQPDAREQQGEDDMTVNVDELGPVDWMVVEFEESKLNGQIAPILKDYVDRDLIRVLDLLFLKKDVDGSFEAFEAADMDDTEIGE